MHDLDYEINRATVFKFQRLVFLMDRITDRILQDNSDMTLSQFLILIGLETHPKCAQQRIASFLGFTQAAVSRQIELLTEKKYIERHDNAENRREHILKLTALGKEKLEIAHREVDVKFKTIFEILDNKEKEELNSSLNKLLEVVHKNFQEVLDCPKDK